MKNKSPVTQRKPAQKRGLERIQQILDAAEILITEKGTEGITVRELAKLSATSVGSFYHFFADTDAVLAQLRQRYNDMIGELLRRIAASGTEDEWRQKNAHDFINDIFSPYARFLVTHRAYLPVVLTHEFDYRESAFHSQLTIMMKVRQPTWTDEKIALETHFMHATALGVIKQIFQRDTAMVYLFLPRIIRLLVWELEMIEKT